MTLNMISSNEAITIRLLHPLDGRIIHEFHPSYTYYFYGNDETVSENSRCIIEMQSDGLQTRVHATTEIMRLPLDSVLSYDQSSIDLQPFKHTSFTHQDSVYTVYKFAITDVPQWHRRVRIMSLFYIEGASLPDEIDPKWNIYAIYEQLKVHPATCPAPTEILCGYCTAYAFLMFPDKTRMRLSQFVILPPYQGRSLGTEFYKKVMTDWQMDEDIKEVTVEDPNKNFSAMRLKADYQLFFLAANDAGMHKTHNELKITKAHWDQLKQLHLFKSLGDTDAFRLQYKKWLLKVRSEEFSAHDADERKRELQAAYEEDVQLFRRVLGR